MRQFRFVIGLVVLLGAGCTSTPPASRVSRVSKAPPVNARADIDGVLTDFHDAADKGDFDRYFGLFTDDAIFYGTDPEERWTVDEFKGYARAPFEDGHGWTYHMRERNIFVASGNDAAWFDEIVESEHYGKCRGSGALVYTDGGWKLTQYNLVIPVPNDFADEVVVATREGLIAPRTIYVVRHAEKLTDTSGNDPALSEEGIARADCLAGMLVDAGIDGLYSTDFNRTRSTLEPAAEAFGLEIEFYNPRDSAGLAELIRSVEDLDAALVVGHSNTVPAILTALGIEHEIALDESEYDHLFIVSIDQLDRATMTHLHF